MKKLILILLIFFSFVNSGYSQYSLNDQQISRQVTFPCGNQLQRVGLHPYIDVHPTIKGIRADKDEILEKAVKSLEEKISKQNRLTFGWFNPLYGQKILTTNNFKIKNYKNYHPHFINRNFNF